MMDSSRDSRLSRSELTREFTRQPRAWSTRAGLLLETHFQYRLPKTIAQEKGLLTPLIGQWGHFCLIIKPEFTRRDIFFSQFDYIFWHFLSHFLCILYGDGSCRIIQSWSFSHERPSATINSKQLFIHIWIVFSQFGYNWHLSKLCRRFLWTWLKSSLGLCRTNVRSATIGVTSWTIIREREEPVHVFDIL